MTGSTRQAACTPGLMSPCRSTRPAVTCNLLAAVIANPTGCGEMRESLRSLKQKGQGKLHWQAESDPRRRKITAAIAQLDACATVVIGTPVARSNPERARRKCLEVLLLRLEAAGVGQVWLENRQSALNKRDAKTVLFLRGAQLLSRHLRLDFAHPSEEPMLWLPDAVAGAVGLARRGAPEFRDALGGMVEEVDIHSA